MNKKWAVFIIMILWLPFDFYHLIIKTLQNKIKYLEQYLYTCLESRYDY